MAEIPTAAALQSRTSAVSNRSARISLSLEKLSVKAATTSPASYLIDPVRELAGLISDFVQGLDSLAVLLGDASSASGPTRQRLVDLLSSVEETMVTMTSVLEAALPRQSPPVSESELRALAASGDLWRTFSSLMGTFLNIIQLEDQEVADQILESSSSEFEQLNHLKTQYQLENVTISDEPEPEPAPFSPTAESKAREAGLLPNYDQVMASSSSQLDVPQGPEPVRSPTIDSKSPPPKPTGVGKFKQGKAIKSLFRHVSSGFNKPEPLMDPFCRAAAQGNIDQVRSILAQGANPNGHNEAGHTPLTSAIANGHLEMVQFLLQNGANVTTNGSSPHYPVKAFRGDPKAAASSSTQNPNTPSSKSLPPLYHAANTGNIPIISHLLYCGADPKARSTFGADYFIDTVETAPLEAIGHLLAHGADPNADTFFGKKIIAAAVERGDIPLARLLLDHGGKVSASSSSGTSMVGIAVANRNLDLARLLLERGADPNTVSTIGTSLLSNAVALRNLDMVKLLLEFGANPTTSRDAAVRGNPVVVSAVQKDFLPGLKVLLEAGADPNAKDFTGRYVLILTIQQGKRGYAQALLEAGANAKVTGLTGSHILSILLRQDMEIAEMEAFLRLLLAHGSDPDTHATSWSGNSSTPMGYCVKFERPQLVRAMVQAGSDPHRAGLSGAMGSSSPGAKDTPFMYAVTHGKADSVRAMLDDEAAASRLKLATEGAWDVFVDRVLEAAASNGDKDVMMVLLEFGIGDVERALTAADATAHRGLVHALQEKAREERGKVPEEAKPEEGVTKEVAVDGKGADDHGEGPSGVLTLAGPSDTGIDAGPSTGHGHVDEDAPPPYEKTLQYEAKDDLAGR